MIEIFTGRIGGGKTYAVVEEMARRIATGATVYSNVEINLPGFARLLAKRYGVAFDLDSLRPLPDGVHGWWKIVEWGRPDCPVLVVIDEAQVFYNSRDWSRTQSQHAGMLSFLTQSRKACVDVIFVTQHQDNIDKQFRLLSQRVWSFRDMSKVAVLSDFISNYFLAVAADYSGEIQARKLVPKSRLVFEAYDTLSFLDDTMKTLEGGTDRLERRRLRRIGWLRRWLGRDFMPKESKVETDWSHWEI